MTTEIFRSHYQETHEEFVERASRVFPVDNVRTWSRIERAVFNHLLGRMISKHGYGSISNQMLEESRDSMKQVVHQLQTEEPANGVRHSRRAGDRAAAPRQHETRPG